MESLQRNCSVKSEDHNHNIISDRGSECEYIYIKKKIIKEKRKKIHVFFPRAYSRSLDQLDVG